MSESDECIHEEQIRNTKDIFYQSREIILYAGNRQDAWEEAGGVSADAQ